MQIASMHFKTRAHASLHDEQLQQNLRKFQGKFVPARRNALVELDDVEATREAARQIRQRALDELDTWLELFEERATAAGATVLWADTPADMTSRITMKTTMLPGIPWQQRRASSGRQCWCSRSCCPR